MAGLYIHIPFCTHACPYCDFSFELLKDGRVDRLLAALEAEAERRVRESPWPDTIVDTVFLGGGTPTCLTDRQLDRVFGMIHAFFRVDSDAEITVEANPETVRTTKLQRLRDLGANRLSIGVQSFSDDILRRLGRRHTADQAVTAIVLAREAGFENVNLDLMFGVPGQAADWADTLERAVSLDPEHVSVYGLTIEPGTDFARMKEEGLLDLPGEARHVACYYQALDRLAAAGYRHYEVSNLSKPGFACRHNVSCWNGGDYLGLGPSAHSHLAGRRLANTRGLADYLSAMDERGEAVDLDETLTVEERIHEYILLGLRSVEGMDSRAFRDRFGEDAMGKRAPAIHTLAEEGLLAERGSRIRLTRKGLALADSVCAYLM
ncbi:MAG: radical SAM family heme chaperone HemW [Gemmatimonadetes bacterium]|nr:radical SAM family heme chaperone HemW [Gemmatimonadota bacterium]